MPTPRRTAAASARTGVGALTAAERARSVAARGGHATLQTGEGGGRVPPELHHVADDGATLLLLRTEHPLIAAAGTAARGELPAMLEITDTAPVPLREPVRGLLWITGWVRVLGSDAARSAAVTVAERRPDPRLLDVGHGASVLRMLPASLVLADAAGTASVHPTEFALARPDPFCADGDRWLRHLDECHPEVIENLSRHVPVTLRSRGGRVRPLGLDRFGLRLRVETADGDHDVRLHFSGPVGDAEELDRELRRLAG